jgi:hypothetical protein
MQGGLNGYAECGMSLRFEAVLWPRLEGDIPRASLTGAFMPGRRVALSHPPHPHGAVLELRDLAEGIERVIGQ